MGVGVGGGFRVCLNVVFLTFLLLKINVLGGKMVIRSGPLLFSYKCYLASPQPSPRGEGGAAMPRAGKSCKTAHNGWYIRKEFLRDTLSPGALVVQKTMSELWSLITDLQKITNQKSPPYSRKSTAPTTYTSGAFQLMAISLDAYEQ